MRTACCAEIIKNDKIHDCKSFDGSRCMRRAVGCDRVFGRAAADLASPGKASGPGWARMRDSLLGQHGGNVSFKVKTNRLRARVHFGCILDAASRFGAGAGADTASALSGNNGMVVPSNRHMCGNANKTAWFFSGRKNVDGRVREECGPELLQEIQQAKLRAGTSKGGAFLEPGQVHVTSAPNISCVSKLLHVIGPSSSAEPGAVLRQLESVYSDVLLKGDALGLRALFVPAVSTGVLRVPFELSAKAASTALLRHPPDGTIEEVHLVTVENPGAIVFANQFNEAFSS